MMTSSPGSMQAAQRQIEALTAAHGDDDLAARDRSCRRKRRFI